MPFSFSRKELFALIWPLFIEQLLVITLGFADIVMVASLGDTAVSGVSIVDSINVLVTGLLGAMAAGGAVVCGHYFGSRNAKMVSLTAKQLIYSCIGISLIIMIAGLILQKHLLYAVFGNVEADVMHNAYKYFLWTLLSYPFIALYSACAAIFRSQGNSAISMLISLLINVLNIGGNAICIYVLKMGTEGVAIPTLISRSIAAAIVLFLLYNSHEYNGKPAINIKGILKIKLDFKIIKNILGIGIPNGIENSMFQVGKILILTLMAGFGTGAIAANAAAGTITTFAVLPGSAMGIALLTVVSQCLGAGKRDEAVYFTRRLIMICYAAMAIINILFFIFTEQIVGIFKLGTEAENLAVSFIRFHSVCAIFIWIVSFTLPNALRAAGDAKFTMIVSLSSMWIVRMGLSYVFAYKTDFGAIGIWYAMVIDWIVRSVFFIVRWHQGKWKTRQFLD
ncbi:MAG: MATE family efflux transporter [Termitinemataceae bacterium]|nr:MAG: MATE family efflux transporter [Termitinemataceae bacterium]